MAQHKIDEVLDDLGPLPDEPQQSQGQSYNGNGNRPPFDMPAFLAKHGLRARSIKQDGQYGIKYILEECPYDASHKAPDSFVAVMPSGALVFKCSHNSCESYKWTDLRERFEPGYRNKREQYQQPSGPQQNNRADDNRPALNPPQTFREMAREYPALRPPIIHGLLREGETANLIAATKVGKSWLALSLALCVITGKRWLGTFTTTPGNVLIIDNELHRETITHRVQRVADALEIGFEEYADGLQVESLRGKLRDVNGLGELLLRFNPGDLKLIVVDAFYRCLPRGADENKNADVAAIYNTIDAYADRLRCAFASVHHATKGSQTNKTTTDIGSGAGSFSRAADCHFVLRPHVEKDVAIVEAALRSWPPLDPLALRWAYPLWQPDESVDPNAMPVVSSRKAASGGVPFDPAKPSKFQVTLAKILEVLTAAAPLTKRKIREQVSAGVETVNDAIEALLETGRIEEVEIEMHNGNQTAYQIPKPGSVRTGPTTPLDQSP